MSTLDHEEGLPLPTLAGMMLATSLAPLGSTMIAVALPRIGHDLNVEVSALTPWLVSSYLVTSIALQSPGGTFGDRIGHGRALLAGLTLVALGSVLGLLVGDVRALGLARVLTAAGGAATVPATMAILRNRTPVDRRARVFGLFGACMGLAAGIGPLVGGELTERFGWRSVFAANLPVIALSILLVLASRGLLATSRAAGRPAPSFDWPGSVLLAAGLTLLIAALRTPGATATGLAAGGVALLVAFLLWEQHAPSPVVDFYLLKRPAFVGGGSIIALQNMAMYPILFQLPVFFERARGLSPRTMGQALLSVTVAMMLSSMAAGRLVERVGARMQALIGSLMALAGMWWFTDMASVAVPLDVMPGMVLLGAGVGLTSPPAQAASMNAVDHTQAGMAGGMLSTLRYLGGVAGTTVLSTLLMDPANAASHQPPVYVYAGALLAAAALSLTLPGRPIRLESGARESG